MLKRIGMAAGPILFGVGHLIQPEVLTQPQWYVVLVAAWMLCWWLTEAVPIAVAALLPIVLFPLGNVLSIKEVCASYGHYLVFLFLGGFLLALGIEKWRFTNASPCTSSAALATAPTASSWASCSPRPS